MQCDESARFELLFVAVVHLVNLRLLFILVKRLTSGTSTSPAIIAIAPQLMGEARFSGSDAAAFVSSGKKPRLNRNIDTTVIPTPQIKLAQHAVFVTLRENSP